MQTRLFQHVAIQWSDLPKGFLALLVLLSWNSGVNAAPAQKELVLNNSSVIAKVVLYKESEGNHYAASRPPEIIFAKGSDKATVCADLNNKKYECQDFTYALVASAHPPSLGKTLNKESVSNKKHIFFYKKDQQTPMMDGSLRIGKNNKYVLIIDKDTKNPFGVGGTYSSS